MSDPIDLVRARLRDVPDFPKPGILFKDITPVLGDAAAFSAALDALVAYAAPRGVTRVLGVEARGFIFGAALATRMNLGFVPARKPGKLPAEVDRVTYALEYGSDSLELHVGSFAPGERVLVVDDVIATGGHGRGGDRPRRAPGRGGGGGGLPHRARLPRRARAPPAGDGRLRRPHVLTTRGF